MVEDEIRTVASDLVSDDSEQRKHGYLAIKKFGGKAAETLLQAAHEWSEQQKIGWLGTYGGGSSTDFLVHAISDENAIDALIKALHDPDPRFRGFAVLAIGEIKDPRVPDLLVEAFADVDPLVRRNAIVKLQSIGDERSYKLIISAMSDNDDKVRSQAAHALGWVGGTECAGLLMQALDDTSERVAASAAGALGRLYIESAVKPLLDATHSGKKHLSQAAIRALGKIGGLRAVDGLLEILQTSESIELRRSIASVLVKLNTDSMVQIALNMFEDTNAQIRNLAVEVIGKLHYTHAADLLMTALGDPEIYISATFALAEIGDKRAIKPLLNLLKKEDMDRYIYNEAAKALAGLHNYEGLHYLIELLNSNNRNDISFAIHALGESKNLEAVDPLLEFMASSNSNSYRETIINAIAKIDNEKSHDILMAIMKDGSSDSIDAAANLARCGFDEGFAFLEIEINSGDNIRQTRALSKLMHISNPRSVALLISELDKCLLEKKHIIFYALGNIGDQTTITYLESYLNDENYLTRNKAYKAIRCIEHRIFAD